jgi:O-antigen/teichoic acid export membrane protein
MGYKKDVIKGVSWNGSLSFFTKAIGFLEIIILARILVPEQFGAYSIALLTLGLLEVLTETGVNIVLIQEKEIDHLISSAWLVSIARGFIITIILFLSSSATSSFFHSPLSLKLLELISFVPLLRGFINPSVVKFQKELLFGKDFLYSFVILIIDTTVSITVTYITKNPIGIVIGLLSGVVFEMVTSFFIVSPRPGLHFESSYIKKIFHRGKWVTGTAIFDYLFYNVDNIAVGRLLGATALGYYQIAYSLSVIPLSEIGKVFTYVTFPVFKKISQDKVRLWDAFSKTVLVICIFSIPFALILFFFPKIMIFILGNKWTPIIYVLPVLAVLGVLKAIPGAFYALFTSVNKQEYTMLITLVNILGMVIPIIPLVLRYNIVGAAMAGTIGAFLSIPFFIYYTRKIFSTVQEK